MQASGILALEFRLRVCREADPKWPQCPNVHATVELGFQGQENASGGRGVCKRNLLQLTKPQTRPRYHYPPHSRLSVCTFRVCTQVLRHSKP